MSSDALSTCPSLAPVGLEGQPCIGPYCLRSAAVLGAAAIDGRRRSSPGHSAARADRNSQRSLSMTQASRGPVSSMQAHSAK
eukprot:6481726-Pyramimonas_sp.AAC.1